MTWSWLWPVIIAPANGNIHCGGHIWSRNWNIESGFEEDCDRAADEKTNAALIGLGFVGLGTFVVLGARAIRKRSRAPRAARGLLVVVAGVLWWFAMFAALANFLQGQ